MSDGEERGLGQLVADEDRVDHDRAGQGSDRGAACDGVAQHQRAGADEHQDGEPAGEVDEGVRRGAVGPGPPDAHHRTVRGQHDECGREPVQRLRRVVCPGDRGDRGCGHLPMMQRRRAVGNIDISVDFSVDLPGHQEADRDQDDRHDRGTDERRLDGRPEDGGRQALEVGTRMADGVGDVRVDQGTEDGDTDGAADGPGEHRGARRHGPRLPLDRRLRGDHRRCDREPEADPHHEAGHREMEQRAVAVDGEQQQRPGQPEQRADDHRRAEADGQVEPPGVRR